MVVFLYVDCRTGSSPISRTDGISVCRTGINPVWRTGSSPIIRTDGSTACRTGSSPVCRTGSSPVCRTALVDLYVGMVVLYPM